MKEGDRWGEGKRGRTRWLRNADMQRSCFKYNSTIPLEIWIPQKHLKFSKAKQYTDIITLVTHTMCAPSPLAADNIFHNVTARSQDHNDFRYPTRPLFIFGHGTAKADIIDLNERTRAKVSNLDTFMDVDI